MSERAEWEKGVKCLFISVMPALLFESLPDAVLRHVARFLDAQDVCALAATCRRLHSLLAPVPQPSPSLPSPSSPPPASFSMPLCPRIPTVATSSSTATSERPSLFDDDDEEEEEGDEGDESNSNANNNRKEGTRRSPAHSRASSTSSSFDEWFRRAVERGEARRSLARSQDGTSSPVSPRPTSAATTTGNSKSEMTGEGGEGEEQEEEGQQGPPFRVLVERPECKALKHAIAGFVRQFGRNTRGDVGAQQRALHAFFAATEPALRSCVLWRGASAATLASAAASLRDYVFEEVFSALYVRRELQARDAATARHHARLRRVVTPAFLELPPAATASASARAALARAAAALRRIDSVRAPRAKLACIGACARTIAAVLAAGGARAGADDFLPVLIHVVLDAQLLHVASDVQYIAAFADPAARFGEAYCYYTHFVSAVAFLDSLQPEAVLDATEARRRADEAAAARRAKDYCDGDDDDDEDESNNDKTLVRMVRDRETVQRLHFMYSSAATLGDPEDVQLLLDEYRRAASVCRRHLPRFAGAQPWPRPPRVSARAVALPTGAVVTAVCLAPGGCAWLGLRSGRVAAVSLVRTTPVTTVPVFRTPVARLCPVGPHLWCVSASGTARALDPASLALLPTSLVLHAPPSAPSPSPSPPPPLSSSSSSSRRLFRLPFLAGSEEEGAAGAGEEATALEEMAPPCVCVRDVVYSEADDTGWSAATLCASDDDTHAETELCIFTATPPRVRARVRIAGRVSQLCLRGNRLAALFDDGAVRLLHPATGEVIATCSVAPLPPELPPPQQQQQEPLSCGACRLCWSETGDALWLAEGGVLRCGAGGGDAALVPLRVRPASCAGAALVAAAPGPRSLVVSAGTAPRVVVWNAATRTPAAVLRPAPAAPDALACAPLPDTPGTLAVLVVKGSCLFTWVIEPREPSPSPSPRRKT